MQDQATTVSSASHWQLCPSKKLRKGALARPVSQTEGALASACGRLVAPAGRDVSCQMPVRCIQTNVLESTQYSACSIL